MLLSNFFFCYHTHPVSSSSSSFRCNFSHNSPLCVNIFTLHLRIPVLTHKTFSLNNFNFPEFLYPVQLKPSMDYSTLRPLRSGSLLHTPTFQNTFDSYSSDALAIGALCLGDNGTSSTPKHRIPIPSDDSFNSSSKSSSFDSPPEMPSPPVPPRVSNSNHAKTKIDLPVSMFQNQFVNNDFFSINTSVAAPPIAPIRKSHIEVCAVRRIHLFIVIVYRR